MQSRKTRFGLTIVSALLAISALPRAHAQSDDLHALWDDISGGFTSGGYMQTTELGMSCLRTATINASSDLCTMHVITNERCSDQDGAISKFHKMDFNVADLSMGVCMPSSDGSCTFEFVGANNRNIVHLTGNERDSATGSVEQLDRYDNMGFVTIKDQMQGDRIARAMSQVITRCKKPVAPVPAPGSTASAPSTSCSVALGSWAARSTNKFGRTSWYTVEGGALVQHNQNPNGYSWTESFPLNMIDTNEVARYAWQGAFMLDLSAKGNSAVIVNRNANGISTSPPRSGMQLVFNTLSDRDAASYQIFNELIGQCSRFALNGLFGRPRGPAPEALAIESESATLKNPAVVDPVNSDKNAAEIKIAL